MACQHVDVPFYQGVRHSIRVLAFFGQISLLQAFLLVLPFGFPLGCSRYDKVPAETWKRFACNGLDKRLRCMFLKHCSF